MELLHTWVQLYWTPAVLVAVLAAASVAIALMLRRKGVKTGTKIFYSVATVFVVSVVVLVLAVAALHGDTKYLAIGISSMIGTVCLFALCIVGPLIQVQGEEEN